MPVLAQNPHKDKVQLSSLSMLDIVNYFNTRPGPVPQPKVGFNTDEVNCVPHFDPGLFSLSILSTCDGLQLNDLRQDQWVDGPNDCEDGQRSIGVIWLGEAASIMTGNQFKCGIHRVVYPRIPHQARLTVWQEVCTKTQIDTLLKSNGDLVLMSGKDAICIDTLSNSVPLQVQYGEEFSNDLMNHVENEHDLSKTRLNCDCARLQNSNDNDQYTEKNSNLKLLPGGASVTMTNQPNSEPLQVESNGETLNHFMKRVESERGLSMSKSGIEHIQIRFPMRVRKTPNQSNNKFSFLSKLFKW
ncbi:unnamed protein product [Rotaria sp. Silwood2]|nr:unnamed protein product [Rotaria sp. Silwood2]CAF2522399.1 unnamed protein product [Rotaria sp. Silwood2]CAF2782483.1 unnamed protein product [Rotaria sp. Silwood2]CAF2955877.1 unnamed protein product [Rotaria sp. Silwood2]CAF4088145.1 unnamed protein product [Rotaria sp. Silwood2]